MARTAKELGKELKEYRRLAGYTPGEVASKLGVVRQTIYRWERGDDMPRVDVYFGLLEFYGLNPLATNNKLGTVVIT